MENNYDDILDGGEEEQDSNPFNITLADLGKGLATLTVIVALGIGTYSCSKDKARAETIPASYGSLTNKVEILAQKGDTVSELMLKYSGFPAEGRALYEWQMDNDRHPSKDISFGKKYIFRTTNTASRTSN